MQALRAKQYVRASNEFFNATLAGDSATKMKAQFGLAQSLQNLNYNYSASKYYSLIVRSASTGSSLYRQSMEELGNINKNISLGQSHIIKLFDNKGSAINIPGSARGFYFFYSGLDAFSNQQPEKALKSFTRVPPKSPYYTRALFYTGIVRNITGRHNDAIKIYKKVLKLARNNEQGKFTRELANLNIARIYYEKEEFRKALDYYARIPRDSGNWLDSLFEASWTFFMLQKHNNTLGTIHTIQSPFFRDRFYPETYVLQAITHLKLCREKRVKLTAYSFRNHYRTLNGEMEAVLKNYNRKKAGFYQFVTNYQRGNRQGFKRLDSIMDKLSRTDIFKESADISRFSSRELIQLRKVGEWKKSGLQDDLIDFLRKKKKAAAFDSGKRLFRQLKEERDYLQELETQFDNIQIEMSQRDLDKLRRRIDIKVKDKKGDFVGGLKPLKIGQAYEYWPFEGEYWEDELGYYVYNIDSLCKSSRSKSK